jgi:hypothetical protein
MAKPFLKAGLPIYIDKPLAYSMSEAEEIYALQQYDGQIFTCSALSYSNELRLSQSQKDELGDILFIEAQVMKSWNKYAIHVVDPVLNLIDSKIASSTVFKDPTLTRVDISCENRVGLSFTAYQSDKIPIEIKITGMKKTVVLVFSDTFHAFKAALQSFINIVQGVEAIQDRQNVLRRIAIIEKGI